MRSLQTVLSLSTLYYFVLASAAASTNVTIDDTYGDSVTGLRPVYSAGWNIGQDCSGCAITPDESKAFMGTWHDTTSDSPLDSTNIPHQVTLTFRGTAIWVHCILANFNESSVVTTFTNASFELDGIPAAIYHHQPDGATGDFEYNVTVYSQTGLSNIEHTLVMTAEQGKSASLLLFDWAEYTIENGTSISSTDSGGSSSSVASSSSASASSSTGNTSSAVATTSSHVSSTMLVLSSSTPATSTKSAEKTNSLSAPGASHTAPSTPSASATKSGAATYFLADAKMGSFALMLSVWALM
ncbi:hypothetical protein C8Q72DRAFT_858228 [Fomitopsis betulina]|nr:hypothetical protein C8Q72DRAFT_858228 [Fomitopsis betulina]